MASTGIALPAQTLTIIPRLGCLAVPELAIQGASAVLPDTPKIEVQFTKKGQVPFHAGATGDNAHRPSGFWFGLFACVQINQGRTSQGSAALRLETAVPKHSSEKRQGGHRLHDPSSIYILRVVGTNGAELGEAMWWRS